MRSGSAGTLVEARLRRTRLVNGDQEDALSNANREIGRELYGHLRTFFGPVHHQSCTLRAVSYIDGVRAEKCKQTSSMRCDEQPEVIDLWPFIAFHIVACVLHGVCINRS